MTRTTRNLIYFFAGVVFMLMLGIATAQAGGNHTVTNNYYITEVTEVAETNVTSWRITDSLSEKDLNEIIGSTLAGASHQFDYSTTRWQLSITGATNTSDWDEDSNFSFAVGRRFGKDSWAPNALFHVGYTPDIAGNDYIHGGATIVLDQ